ncbi:class I SAM-dependent methyltransferase [Aldersonia sp. NBC_00410]|uniref:class I SAM-dependent methyltransferase n=1 Tax=Aldersonia sp. NBC_00410 TaxID=2975954 RepID=UPI00224ECAE5|nr:class I SAM-dependent methyltransferase [Aldersonia sp. NBC_00410]MCX5041715.1 class I SAM-dependent methyltransferase [Aldersonia sp. NBC_00410]
MRACRGCGGTDLHTVLDVGAVPAADYFPPADEPVRAGESAHPLVMVLCETCALAQLADDDTVTQEPRGVEPQALRDQAEDAVSRVSGAGWLRGGSVREFGSPHGGSWLPLLQERGFSLATPQTPASLVLDTLGIMHEPDQRAAFRERAESTAPDGVLLLQYHSLVSIVTEGQWNALRHGHFAYYSLHALLRLLADAGMSPASAWEFDLYGGTVLIAAVHGQVAPDAAVAKILAEENELGICDHHAVSTLQGALDEQVGALREWLCAESATGRRVFAYSAASRAVALFSLANVDRRLVQAVADASPTKQGRRMPGTDVPIISPADLTSSEPDKVLLTLPDLLPEISQSLPSLAGRWVVRP